MAPYDPEMLAMVTDWLTFIAINSCKMKDILISDLTTNTNPSIYQES